MDTTGAAVVYTWCSRLVAVGFFYGRSLPLRRFHLSLRCSAFSGVSGSVHSLSGGYRGAFGGVKRDRRGNFGTDL